LPRVFEVVSLGEGGTPLQKADRLADSLHFKNLYLKDETRNPTNSFKDRSAALIISDAKSRGYDSIVCASNGNHGASISAYAAKEDIQCNLVIPVGVDMGKLAQMLMYDAKIVQTGDNIEDAIKRSRELEKEMDWLSAFPVNEMLKFGWLPDTREKHILADSMLKFFSVATSDEWQQLYINNYALAQYGKSTVNEQSHHAISAWLRKGEIQAREIDIAEFDKRKFKNAFRRSCFPG